MRTRGVVLWTSRGLSAGSAAPPGFTELYSEFSAHGVAADRSFTPASFCLFNRSLLIFVLQSWLSSYVVAPFCYSSVLKCVYC